MDRHVPGAARAGQTAGKRWDISLLTRAGLARSWRRLIDDPKSNLKTHAVRAAIWPVCAVGEACDLLEIDQEMCEEHHNEAINDALKRKHELLAELGTDFHTQIYFGRRGKSRQALQRIERYVKEHGPETIKSDVWEHVERCNRNMHEMECDQCEPDRYECTGDPIDNVECENRECGYHHPGA